MCLGGLSVGLQEVFPKLRRPNQLLQGTASQRRFAPPLAASEQQRSASHAAGGEMGRLWSALILTTGLLALHLVATAPVQGMDIAPVQGYRLKVPPCGAWYCRILAFRWWEQVEVYDRFTECERGKQVVLAAARDDQAREDELNRQLEQNPRVVPGERKVLRITRVWDGGDPRLYAECEAVR